MTNLVADKDRNNFSIKKLFNEIPGKSADIAKNFSTLLQNPEADIAMERASHIKPIRHLLQDEKWQNLLALQ